MLMKKTCIAAGLALALIAPAFGDTPIGPGVTGSGGTGANKSDDPSTGAGPGTEVRPAQREANMPAAPKANASAAGDAKAGARTGATGATGGAGAGASGSAGPSGSGAKSGGATQY